MTGVPEPAAARRRVGVVERVKIAGKLGLPVRVSRKAIASGEGWTAQLDPEMRRGLDDAFADAVHSRRRRRSPAWLVTQPPLYIWGYRIGQLTVAVMSAGGVDGRDGAAGRDLFLSAARYLLALRSRFNQLNDLDSITEAHAGGIEAANAVREWSEREAAFAFAWLADNRGVIPAPGDLDDQNWWRVYCAAGL